MEFLFTHTPEVFQITHRSTYIMTTSVGELSIILHAEYDNKDSWAVTCDFQQCGILTSVDSNEPVQPPLNLETRNDVRSVALES